jgi:hypothetical protein
MIKIENVETFGWEAAIRGMRNPKNSWAKSDSHKCPCADWDGDCPMVMNDDEPAKDCDPDKYRFCVGENDFHLMQVLANSGPDDGKFLRMIHVQLDVTAPLYWWKEADQYKVGTVTDSCSTMHKIHAKEFELDDFSHEHIINSVGMGAQEIEVRISPMQALLTTIECMNSYRKLYLETKDKKYWWQMIQLLPSSYNQRRTWDLNYAVLRNIYHARRNHKLDEWRELCAWIETLPYSELITGKGENTND